MRHESALYCASDEATHLSAARCGVARAAFKRKTLKRAPLRLPLAGWGFSSLNDKPAPQLSTRHAFRRRRQPALPRLKESSPERLSSLESRKLESNVHAEGTKPKKSRRFAQGIRLSQPRPRRSRQVFPASRRPNRPRPLFSFCFRTSPKIQSTFHWQLTTDNWFSITPFRDPCPFPTRSFPVNLDLAREGVVCLAFSLRPANIESIDSICIDCIESICHCRQLK